MFAHHTLRALAMSKIRENIFSIATLYSFFLLLAILFMINKPKGKKDSDSGLRLVEKSGIIYQIGSDKPFTGQVKDTVQNKIIEYNLISGKKYGDFIVKQLNGTLEINGSMNDNKNEGVWHYYYSDGSLESTGTFYNDKLEGAWKWYFPNGKIRVEGYFQENQRVGTWKFYDEKARVVKEISYRNDTIELVRNFDTQVSL